MAVHAIIRFLNGRRVVTLGVELGRKFENVPWGRTQYNTHNPYTDLRGYAQYRW